MNATLARLHRLTESATGAPDGALVEAFLAGDQSAFGLLVRRHAGLVLATCRRVLRHQQDAEDAFQATFLVLARRAGDVWPRAAVGSWLFGVAHRVALKARAVRARRTAHEELLEDVPAPDRPTTDTGTMEAVQRAIANLPEVYRAAVIACDLQGLSRKAAAERLGWSEGTLSGRLARARALLAARLKRKGVCLPAGGAGAALVGSEEASAALVRTTCGFATKRAVPAPILALTNGAVKSMSLFNFKALAAAGIVACALGFGALGAPRSDEPGAQQNEPSAHNGGTPVAAKQNPAAPEPRLELAQQELAVIRQELLAVEPEKLDAAALEKLQSRLEALTRLLDANDRLMNADPPLKPLTDSILLQGAWQVAGITDGDKALPLDPKEPATVVLRGSTLALPYKEIGKSGWGRREYRVAVDGTKSPKTIDLIRSGEPVGYGMYEFAAPATTCVKCHGVGNRYKIPDQTRLAFCIPALKQVAEGKLHADGLRLAFSVDGKRPAKFGGAGVLVFELTRTQKPEEKSKPLAPAVVADQHRKALIEAQRAQVLLNSAAAKVEQAQAELAAAHANHKFAQDQLTEAERALASLQKITPAPAKDTSTFTVHLRTLAAPEKAVLVPATGKETVIDALARAADVPLKPDSISAWVVRGDLLLPVDLIAITNNGVTKTNYTLKAGDRLFVQEKPAR